MVLDLPIFREPQCLIGTGLDGRLEVGVEVVDQLRQLDQSCVVIAVAGLYRTGKSYLMNRLAGSTTGFALGSTIQSKTKGIWIWARDHPVHKDQYIVLLDTEGLGDAEKGDPDHDNWIFCLATLLSSVLVYNAFGVINEDALAKLNFITEMSKHIRTKMSPSDDDADFDWYFPLFIFVLRDFTLDLEVDGREVTADEYMEHCLTLKKGEDSRSKRFNMPRLCIRRYFKKRKCFTFDRPTGRKNLKNLDSLSDGQLSSDFVEETKIFLEYIFNKAPIKKLENGMPINGRMFATLVETYVDAIRDGAVPCIQNAVTSMSVMENTRNVEVALGMYRDLMAAVSLPTPDDRTLLDAHAKALKEAVQFFVKNAVFDNDNFFQNDLNERIQGEMEELVKRNESASVARCRDTLAELNVTIEGKLKAGTYASAGGFSEYQQDVNSLQQQYQAVPGLGIKKTETLLEFLQDKIKEGEGIMAADKKVSAEEKKAEAERQKALEAEKQKEMAEREAEMQKKFSEEREKAMEENIRQMEEQRKREIEQLKEHQAQVMEERLKEQQRLISEGYKKEADQLRSEIEKLKKAPPTPPRGGGGGCVIL